MKTNIYNTQGKEVDSVELPEAIFGLKWNADLVHQVITSMTSSMRGNTAKAKDRSEVRGGGKKPWKQKGTGRARHGSSRSPIWVGGGVTHGPITEKNYDRKVNKSAKTKALAVILSSKFADKQIILVDKFTFTEPKTKIAKEVIANLAKSSGNDTLATKRKNAAIIAVPKRDKNIVKSFSNMSSFLVDDIKNINPVDLVNYKYIIMENPEECLKVLVNRITK